MNSILSPFRAVQGKLPTKAELGNWPTQKFFSFLDFCNHFMILEKGGHRISITTEKIREMEKIMRGPTHPYQEFLFRINQFSTDPESTQRKFLYKHGAFMRNVLGYLKMNPAIITEEMRAIIEPNNRFNWCLRLTKLQMTRVGAEVIVPDTLDNVMYKKKQVQSPNADKMLIDSLIKVANVFDMIAGSIKKKDIESMTPSQKIMALSKLSFVHATARNFKPGSAVFQKINVFQAGKEELESALLDFSKVKDEQ